MDWKTTGEPVASIRCFAGGREVSEDEVRRAVVRAAVKTFMKKMLKKDSPELAGITERT